MWLCKRRNAFHTPVKKEMGKRLQICVGSLFPLREICPSFPLGPHFSLFYLTLPDL